MNITHRALRITAGALVAVMTVAVGGAIAFAAAPPFDPDPDAYGTITFFDAAGNVVTSGTNAAESPKYAVASSNPTSTVLNKRANLALFNPQAGQPTGNWNGTQLNTNTLYPLSAAPATVSSSTFPETMQLPTSQSFAAIAATFVPNTGALANVFQVRLRNVQIRDYASASITIDPVTGAWQQVFPTAPAAPTGAMATPGNTQAVVRWTAPSSTGGAAITGYSVTPIKAGVAQTPILVGDVLTRTVLGLTNGTAYTFRVHAVNLVGPGPDSAASAAITPRVPTRVAITSAPTLSTYATAITVVGKLTRTDTGAAVAGQAVQLQARRKGSAGAFSTVATLASTSLGVVTSTTFKPIFAVELRLVRPVVAGNGFGTSTSPSKVVLCQMKITANLSALSVSLGKSVTLSGVVAPNHRGKTIFLQRKSGTTWVTVTSKLLSATSGYSFSVKPTARGTYFYRVVMKADATFVASVAAAKPLKVI